ncbi:O-methyltransferase [Solitalea koreensis]|uniref:Methyltransferase domain-containing protein n=1 Tax=Solitalea koreensis TaxID=543615 RepID=A0A521AWX0_9SPHI|nr:class I SAM-dependent methyltransferase [Solitalea koreensis]SMO39327.1 Methyltransferase domain-containing protein [Solitalea koreensis]
MNLTLVTAYIKHQLSATTRHGTHSPFVYELVDKVIYDKDLRSDYQTIEQLRVSLLRDSHLINITDLGAGSMYNNNKQKAVKDLAANALKSPEWAQLIYRLIEWKRPQIVIELGTCLGLTTAYMAKAAPAAKVITVEGCPETAAIARKNFENLNQTNISLLVGNFDTIFPELVREQPILDVVYVDGNHRKEATIRYFEQLLPKVNENSMVIFDDIHWSKGMEEAWESIKEHPQVSLTIDLFTIGLVFFRKGQAKEHFRIKY